MDSLIDRLTEWSIAGDGTPGSVPTRYSCEIQLPDHPETADLRCAIRTAFIDGMAFNTALAEAANRAVAA
jgi:hypothetical protein